MPILCADYELNAPGCRLRLPWRLEDPVEGEEGSGRAFASVRRLPGRRRRALQARA